MTKKGVVKFRTIHYENRNLPVFIELADFADVLYLYNVDGQRIFKKVDTDEGENYIMDGGQNVGLFTENSSLTYWNIVTNGTAGRLKTNGDKVFYIKDHLGSTRAVANESGTVVESHDYFPFGLRMPGRSFMSGGTKELFTGMELDAETGLIHIVWRRYDPVIGRWLSVDRLDQYHSPYVYVGNNPFRFSDMFGLASDDTIGIQIPIPLPPVIIVAERIVDDWPPAQFYGPIATGLSLWYFGTTDYKRVLFDGNYFLNESVPAFMVGLATFGLGNKAKGGAAAWNALKVGRPLRKMGHAFRHFDEFRKIDPSITEQDVAKILEYVRKIDKNPLIQSNGRKLYSGTVEIGGKRVKVQVIETVDKTIRTGWPVNY